MYTTKLGHAHLKVRDLDRAIAFYREVFRLEVTEVVAGRYAFLSGGPLHHEIALQELGPGAPQPPPHATGLYHVAFEVPDKRSFALAYRKLADAGVSVAVVDHLISWAMYFADPDGNGLEIYADTRADGAGRARWHGENRPLDAAMLRELADAPLTGAE
ncbi:MAG: VOC family protein [Gemmatimonadetes bacterium]|nr:VOC family protein [Gemmatimonadota bacterium]